MTNFIELSSNFKAIFWDFDGVIKESLAAKRNAFVSIFSNLNQSQIKYIQQHHLSNGGIAREIKIRHYLKYLDLPCDQSSVKHYVNKFSQIVVDKVLASDWVPGALEFISQNRFNQLFFLVSATPDAELSTITSKLNLSRFFAAQSGSSKPKSVFITESIKYHGLSRMSCMMVGDSMADQAAAHDSQIFFVFRRSKNSAVDYESRHDTVIDNFLA